MSSGNTNIESFRRQAAACRHMGAPFTADVLDALADILDESSATGRRIMAWPVEPLADVVPLRLGGGLHALARSGRDADLTSLYHAKSGDLCAVLSAVIQRHDTELETWLNSPPQTNEVMRSAGLMPGLMMAVNRLGLPIELIEIGASAGLNLNLDRFAYNLGGRIVGDPQSRVQIFPEWIGPMPPDAPPKIISREGVDWSPVDVRTDADRLLAYVWPDHTERLERIAAAIEIARAHPPQIAKADAGEWLGQRLSQPQTKGTLRVVMHSVFWQYVPPAAQAAITQALATAAAQATTASPLAHLAFEPAENLYNMAVTLRLWPPGETQVLARVHPHGAKVEWLRSK